MSKSPTLAVRILDTAMEQADNSNWESVKLHSIAESLDISLKDIRQFYPQKDDLVEAWFDRADTSMLSVKSTSEFTELPAKERLHHVIMHWFLSMQDYRRVTRQMLYYKMEFGHIHLQVLGVMRISRTVQWFREAALLKSSNLCRITEEICITTIYLGSFLRWLFDNSEHSEHTSRYLKRAIRHVPSLD